MISTFLKTFHSRASEEQLVLEPDLQGARQNLEGSTLPKDSGRSDQSSPPSQKPATSDYIGNPTTTQHQGFEPPRDLALTKHNFFPSSTTKNNEDEVFSQALLTSPDDLNWAKLIDQGPGIPIMKQIPPAQNTLTVAERREKPKKLIRTKLKQSFGQYFAANMPEAHTTLGLQNQKVLTGDSLLSTDHYSSSTSSEHMTPPRGGSHAPEFSKTEHNHDPCAANPPASPHWNDQTTKETLLTSAEIAESEAQACDEAITSTGVEPQQETNPKDQSVSLPRQKKHLRFSDPLVTDVRLIPAREEKIRTLPPKRKTTARKNKPIGGTPFNHTIPVAIIAPTTVSGHDLPIAEVIHASPIETSAIHETSASS